MAKVIFAPNKLDKSKFTIFLAGSIDMGKSKNWQQEIEDKLKDEDVILFNPRRPDWNCVDWETKAMTNNGIKSYNQIDINNDLILSWNKINNSLEYVKIDKLNIYAATQDAMIRAVNQLHHRPDHLIVDAVPLALDIPQTTLIKGDQKSISVAAASIVAKEYRDHLMRDYDYVYPGYGFAQNMGYGTKEHLAGLEKLGACPIHRHSFSPVQKYLN